MPVTVSRPDWPSTLRSAAGFVCLAALVATWTTGRPLAQGGGEKASPVRPDRVAVDWPQAARDATALSAELAKHLAEGRGVTAQRATRRLESFTVKDGMLPLAAINEITAAQHPAVARSPVPVLAPLDPARALIAALPPAGARKAVRPPPLPLARSVARLQLVAGASGYDLIADASPALLRELGVSVPYLVQVHIGGSAVSYGPEQAGDIVPELQATLPGLRRIARADEITYVFRKYAVPYFLNIGCSGGPAAKGTVSCEQADRIARTILADLQLSGGAPVARSQAVQQNSAANPHPTKVSATFKYFAPGKLLDGTSDQGQGGAQSYDEWGTSIRFPIKDAPAFANSQVFMHGGNCLSTPGTTDKIMPLPKQPGDKFGRYHCQQNSKVLFSNEGEPENYAYPWRDNLCESRAGEAAPECPAQEGHAGQDVRASTCIPVKGNPARCQIDQFPVVAVTDGFAWWKADTNHLRLNSDDGSGLYYMYLHMSPAALTWAKMKKGDLVPVTRGTPVGKIGNWDKTQAGGTTAHLHFEIRRLPQDTKQKGPSLATYFTLIRAYERLIGEVGTELP